MKRMRTVEKDPLPVYEYLFLLSSTVIDSGEPLVEYDMIHIELKLQILDGNWRQFASIWSRWSEEKGVLLL
ncbi:hypothetical protein L2E82_21851 [Cichorium intybus]|uniref:Uncharacterized protein n=1 Tax=Cichorium intybus TaxID=13427 RepID=A0ACB9DWK3_CICIN|nr:hypothetical protein L2E82_21851 [Cichorium intybus]